MRSPLTRRQDLSTRIRRIRVDHFGEDHAAMASLLGVPPGTWLNYERGVAIPAEVLLAVMELTGVAAHWLRTGRGEPRGVSLVDPGRDQRH